MTKYRYEVLIGDVALRIRELIKQTCDSLEVQILSGAVSKDHIHLLVSAPPTIAPSELVRLLKGRSALKILSEYSHLKRKYWGGHFWARGYFCVTVGQMTEDMIKAYIEHHFTPEDLDNFKLEGN